MERIKSNKIILENEIFSGYVYFDNGKIFEITKNEYSYSKEYDFSNLFVSPGFIDIHTHGGNGYSFDGSEDDIVNGCNFHFKHGTTTIVPTISASKLDIMKNAIINIEKAKSNPALLGHIIGAHMEGPYLSQKQSGAQSQDYITEPIENEYLQLLNECGKYIKRWTYAPENDKNGKFLKSIIKYDIIPSMGHTDAKYDDVLYAYNNGCKLVTHLYSCTSTITRENGFRKLGVIESAYLLDDMYVEIICDGKHLPKELIRLVYKIKGADRIALITDSLALAGTKEKHGFMQKTEYIIEDDVCKLMDRSAFAGSIATSDVLVRVAIKEANINLIDAIKMMTITPAKIMKLENKGKIEKNRDADFVVFDNDINIKNVISKGVCYNV